MSEMIELLDSLGHDKSSLKQGEKDRKRMDAWSQKAERERERCDNILDARSKNEDIKR